MVAAVSLIDTVEKSPYAGESAEDVQLHFANELVDAALDELRHIQALDICGPTGKWRRLYVRETEAQLRLLYERWLEQAEPLFERARAMLRASRNIKRFDELMDAIGLTKAHLATTLEDIERGRAQARSGAAVSLEEYRRELRVATGR